MVGLILSFGYDSRWWLGDGGWVSNIWAVVVVAMSFVFIYFYIVGVFFRSF